jgi:hypothetical protein
MKLRDLAAIYKLDAIDLDVFPLQSASLSCLDLQGAGVLRH